MPEHHRVWTGTSRRISALTQMQFRLIEAQVGAVSGGSRRAQRRRAGARCPSHDHPVWPQPVPVRAPFRCAFVGHHTG